jgi:ATP-binding cassette subfamily B protein
MRFHRTSARALERLRPELRLAVLLALGNIAFAIAQFAEPLLLGRIVDRLSQARSLVAPRWSDLAPWLAAWAGFGRLTILASLRIALNADLVLVFHHGRGIESGDFAALVERQGVFADLARA